MADDTFLERALDSLVKHALESGLFESVNLEQPVQQPGNGLTCAVWGQYLGPARNQSGLSSTTARLEFYVRLYMPLVTTFPRDYIDPAMLRAAAAMMKAYSANFTLDGLRCVDLLGAGGGEPLSMRAGYLDQDGTSYRVMTILVPVIVNDVWDQEA